MTDKEALEILDTMAFSEWIEEHEALAVDLAYKALKKRKSYLRQIEIYQERIKNQALEITHLQAKLEEMKGGK